MSEVAEVDPEDAPEIEVPEEEETAAGDDDWRLEGIPDELRDLFRQLIAEGFPDPGESEDNFDYIDPEPLWTEDRPVAAPERAKNFGYGYLGEGQDSTKLTERMISFGMSHAGRAVDTCQLAYLKFEMRNKGLVNIEALRPYIYLRNIDLSENDLVDLRALSDIKNLQVLNVNGNRIESIGDIPEFVWLQALNLSRNALNTIEEFQPNYLTYLSLSHNSLSTAVYFTNDIFKNLLFLEVRGNRLTTLKDMNLPQLRHLYVAQNLLTDLEGLSGCPALELLHARENRISKLTDFEGMDKLKKVNLRGNLIWRFTETIRLQDLPALEILVLVQNPVTRSDRYILELCSACLMLKRLDKTILSELDLINGRLLSTGRQKGVVEPIQDEEYLAQLGSAETRGEQEE